MTTQMGRESKIRQRSGPGIAVFALIAGLLLSTVGHAAALLPLTVDGMPADAVLTAGRGKASPPKAKVPSWAKKRGPTGQDKWNAKCSSGKGAGRSNPAKAAVHPPACART